MRYIGAILLISLVFAIVVGGTYNRQEIVEISIQLVPTPNAQPGLVDSVLVDFKGIHSARLSKIDNQLQIVYDQGRITLEDLNPILISLGYRLLPAEAARIKTAM